MITSLDNKKVKEFNKLHQKKYRDDRYLLLDETLILAAKDSGYLQTLLYVGELPFDFANSIEVSQEVMDKIARQDGYKYIGVGTKIKESSKYGNRVMILDHLQDPLNVGRIMESAYIFGFDSIIISDDSADIYNEKCLKASKGAIYKLNICVKELKDEIKALQQDGYKVCATGLRDNTLELYEVEPTEKMAFVLGNEGSGVTSEIMDICDEIVKIAMVNIDSLNVAMAGSIVMYQFKI
ncbi:MAG: RNA methyltransferase [Erysipelotrichaceae bacterium]|nr:RNA methyltransferase [Erysipelotrichaceae bacterium]